MRSSSRAELPRCASTNSRARAPTRCRAARIGEPFAQLAGQSCCVRDLDGAASLHQQLARDLRRIRGVGPCDHRYPERGRLEQIVAADRHQAAADERRHRPRHTSWRARPWCPRSSTCGAGRTALPLLRRSKSTFLRASMLATLSKRCGWRGTNTSSASANLGAQCAVRVDEHLLLSPMRAARDPNRPRAEVRRARNARPCPFERIARLHVEFHVADRRGCASRSAPMAMNRRHPLRSAPPRALPGAATASLNSAPNRR